MERARDASVLVSRIGIDRRRRFGAGRRARDGGRRFERALGRLAAGLYGRRALAACSVAVQQRPLQSGEQRRRVLVQADDHLFPAFPVCNRRPIAVAARASAARCVAAGLDLAISALVTAGAAGGAGGGGCAAAAEPALARPALAVSLCVSLGFRLGRGDGGRRRRGGWRRRRGAAAAAGGGAAAGAAQPQLGRRRGGGRRCAAAFGGGRVALTAVWQAGEAWPCAFSGIAAPRCRRG